MISWGALSKRFRKAVKTAGGPKTMGSGTLKVIFSPYGEVYVEIGGYDIDAWSRHERVGFFPSEKAAKSATLRKVEEAERIATEEGQSNA